MTRGRARSHARPGELERPRGHPGVGLLEDRADTSRGASAEATVLDVRDEAAVEEHLAGVVARGGGVDISFNLTSREDKQGTPLLDMTVEDFSRGPNIALTGRFTTARAAARRMVQQGSGVILSVTSGTARAPSPGMGNTGPADAAVEVLMRTLAAELVPQGVRVVGIHTAAVAETLTRERIAEVSGVDVDPAVIIESVAQMTTLRRAPRWPTWPTRPRSWPPTARGT